MVGTASATTARKRVAVLEEAASRLKRSREKRVPPTTMLTPPTKRRFPRMEPVMLPFTRSTCPWRRAEMPRINSAALPKVALSRLPAAGPMRSASASVASPIALARGMSDAQATKKVTASRCRKRCDSHAAGSRSQAARQSHRDISRNLEPDRAGGLLSHDMALLFQHFQVAHHFRERQVELVLSRAREHPGGELSRRGGLLAQQLEDALLALLVEGEQPVDHLDMSGEGLRMARRDQLCRQGARPLRGLQIGDQRLVRGFGLPLEI